MRKLCIAIDFDGTIVTHAWPNIGTPIPQAIATMREWSRRGHKLIIWTCRTGKPLAECERWLFENKVPFDAINRNLPERIRQYGGDTRKVSADLYVDDKSAGCVGLPPATLWARAKADVSRLEG